MIKARSNVVGIRSVDNGHQELRCEVGRLLEAQKAKALGEQLVGVLATLHVHVFEYLREEEGLLRAMGALGLQAHFDEHSRIRERIRETRFRFSQSGSSLALAEDTSRVLLDWLQGHVPSMDHVLADDPTQRASTQRG